MSANRFFPIDPKTGKLLPVPSADEIKIKEIKQKQLAEDARLESCKFKFYQCREPHFYYGDQNSLEYCRSVYDACVNAEKNIQSKLY